MKRLWTTLGSLALVLTLLLTLCPMAAFAGDETAVTLDDLTVEMITNGQPENFITEKLCLAEGFTWSASPEGIVDTATGAVTQDVKDDRTVTLTATKDGSSKNFILTVKPKTTEIIYSDNMYYPGEITSYTWPNQTMESSVLEPRVQQQNGQVLAGFNLKSSAGAGNLEDKFIKDSDKNYYLSVDFGKTIAQQVRYDVSVLDGEFIWTFDARGAGHTGGSAGGFDLFFTFKNSEGTEVSGDVLCRVNYNNSGSCVVYGTTTEIFSYNASEWNTITMKIDVNAGTFSVLKDPRTDTWTAPASYMNESNLTSLTSGNLYRLGIKKPEGGKAADTLELDNFAVYKTSLTNLTSEEKIAYCNEQLAANAPTTESAAAITKNLSLYTCDGAITWESSNTSVIAEDGTVTRPTGAVAGQATLTAKCGDTVLATYHYSVAPAGFTVAKSNIGHCDTEDFEEGTAGAALTYYNAAPSGTGSTAKWQYSDSGADAKMTYKTDSERGTVAEIDNITDTVNALKVAYNCGEFGANTDARVAVGFDFKAASDTAFTYTLNGGDTSAKVEFTGSKVNVYSYDKTHLYPYGKTVDVTSSDWVRADIDVNFASRTYMVYLNGVSVSGDMPLMTGNFAQTGNDTAPMRNMQFEVAAGKKLLLDNVSVLKSTNADANKVDAGIKAAQIYFSLNKLSGDAALPAYGPASFNDPLCNRMTGSPFITAGDTTKGAALTWKLNGSDVTSYTNTGLAKPTLTLTATSGSEIKTAEITLDYAPVLLTVADGKVTATGNTAGGKLIVATYTDAARTKLKEAKTYDAFTDVEIGATANYRIMFVNSMESLQPIAKAIVK